MRVTVKRQGEGLRGENAVDQEPGPPGGPSEGGTPYISATPEQLIDIVINACVSAEIQEKDLPLSVNVKLSSQVINLSCDVSPRSSCSVAVLHTPEKAELPQIHDPLFETLAILAAVLYILAAHSCMKMDPWQRNLRMMHHLNEFLDLDSAKSNVVDEFVSLFNAIREGLTHIDDNFQIPDSQINMLFLSKLKSRPEWADWATALLRDPQVNGSDSTARISFQELARWAREEEKAIRMREEEEEDDHDSGIELPVQPPPSTLPTDHESAIDPLGWGGAAPRIQSRSRALTQDEINAFVVQKMDQEGLYESGDIRGHRKRPSQEEINQYVVEQMRREQDRGTRVRSYSQPEPRIANPQHQEQHMRCQQSARVPRCRFCSDLHPSDRCWRRWRVAVEAPQANFFPKRVEYRTEVPGQPPMYRTGFTLY